MTLSTFGLWAGLAPRAGLVRRTALSRVVAYRMMTTSKNDSSNASADSGDPHRSSIATRCIILAAFIRASSVLSRIRRDSRNS
jgi:hypothetical protein